MRYFVPQIKHETTIGGLTISQIIFLAIGFAIAAVIFFNLQAVLGWTGVLIADLVVGMITLILTFGKVNDIPFPAFLVKVIGHYISPPIYIWKRKPLESKPILTHKIETKPIEEKKEKYSVSQKKSRLQRIFNQQF